jgi:hypothetical protein
VGYKIKSLCGIVFLQYLAKISLQICYAYANYMSYGYRGWKTRRIR